MANINSPGCLSERSPPRDHEKEERKTLPATRINSASVSLGGAVFCAYFLCLLQEGPCLHGNVETSAEAERGSDLHDERRACGNVWLLGLQFSVRIVEAVPGGAHHVDHVCVHHREICEATRGNAQHAEVVVERRCAVFDLNALFFVIHGAALCQQMAVDYLVSG